MRKNWVAGGVILLIAVLMVVALRIPRDGGHKETPLEQDSQAFMDKVVPGIVSDWSAPELYSHMDQAVLARAGMTQEHVVALAAWFATIGKMRHYQGSQGKAAITYEGAAKHVLAHYVAEADFEKGPAQIDVALSKDTGEWKIISFQVRSPALTAAKTPW